MLTIDLLRSMIHNLVIGQWGSCSHRAGTLAWHTGQTSPHPCGVHKLGKFQTKLFFPILFLGVQSLRIHDKCHKHCQTFFCCSFIISVIIYIFACYFTVTTDSLLDCCFIFIAFSFCVLQKTNQHRSIQYECGGFFVPNYEIIKHFRFLSAFAATYFIETMQSNSGSRVFMLLNKQTNRKFN